MDQPIARAGLDQPAPRLGKARREFGIVGHCHRRAGLPAPQTIWLYNPGAPRHSRSIFSIIMSRTLSS
jgi:hypothetical protein